MVKVKCNDCGFLALQFRWAHGKGLAEANQDFRNTGSPGLIGNSEYELDGRPICFVRRWNLSEHIMRMVKNKTGDPESASRHALNPMPQEALDVIVEERECNEWTQWHQGSSPKEHQEMLDRDRMLQWQASREEADRKHRRTELKWVIAGVVAVVVAAIVGALATVAGAFIERDGQPTIVINPPPIQMVVPTPPSTSGTVVPQP